MPTSSQDLFTTEQVVDLLGLRPRDKWRVIKFAESKEYDITPARVMGKGLGSRRLYDVENICQIGVALALLEAGLRPSVIGMALRRVGKAARKLKTEKSLSQLFVVLIVEQRLGELLSNYRVLKADFIEEGYSHSPEYILGQLQNSEGHENYAVLFVPIGSVFTRIKRKLKEMNASD